MLGVWLKIVYFSLVQVIHKLNGSLYSTVTILYSCVRAISLLDRSGHVEGSSAINF